MATYRRAIDLALLAGLGLLTCAQALGQANKSEVERGRYLALAGDCISCHTAAGGKPYAGGLPMQTGFGIIYSPNITPDKETGIGSWSAKDFYNAMHTGRDDEGKHLYPAFPYVWFTKVSQPDVQAIKAFLDTLPPVRQANKPTQLPWYMSWRGALWGWNLINFDEGEYKPNPAKSAQWNRGAYLVEGLGHCGQCHTPTRPFGGPERGSALDGGSLPEGWYAPSLSGNQRDGLGRWSAAQIVEYLKTGSTLRTATAGKMSEVVAHSTRHLDDADLESVAVYLKDIPAREATKTTPLTDQALARGQALFVDNCIGCHMYDGGGQPGVFPTLQGSSAIQAKGAGTVIRVVLGGSHIVATASKPTGITMPAFGGKLDDEQVADVVSYIRNAWGNRASSVNAGEVAKQRQSLKQTASR